MRTGAGESRMSASNACISADRDARGGAETGAASAARRGRSHMAPPYGKARRRQILASGPDQPPFAGELEHGLPQLLERTHFDLTDALAADVIDLAQILKRLRIVGEAAFGENVALALVERLERLGKKLVAHVALFGLRDALVLERSFVAEQILPLAVAILAHRHVERRVAAHRHAAVHADHLVLGDAEVLRDLRDIFGRQIAILEGLEI